jgi:phage shock protein C
MQPRLTRSRTDKMIAGVCGGLAEYFRIDPVIVRLIFVLVTLTSGMGIIIYPVLWLLMPKGEPEELIPHDPEAWRQRVQSVGQEAAEFGQNVEREVREVFGARQSGGSTNNPTTYASRPTESYNFDPYTGQPIQPQPQPQPQPAPPRRKGSVIAGIILLGMGLMFAADFLGIPSDIIFPVLMIALGGWMLLKR